MGVLSDKPQYYQPSDRPGPKNGHYSEPHPQYASIFLPMKEQAAPLWANGTVDMIKQVFREAPPAIPEGCPEPDRDIKIQYTKAPARDGTLLELKVYQSVNVQSNAALVFRMHGGGWTVGGHEIEEAENRYIAGLGNVVVISVDYRMAPEFPFPYALNDSYDVLLWLKRNPGRFNINSEKIILVGSSAGANLASIVAIKARDEGVTGIVGQVLAIPVTCHPKFFGQVPNKERYELLSYAQNHDAALVNSPAMEWFWDCYVGKNPSPDPMHSPLLSTNLRGLPPAIVLVAGKDPLRDEGIAYGEALKAAGVPTELRVYSGLPHGWHMGFTLKESKDYYDRVLAFIKDRVANSRTSKL